MLQSRPFWYAWLSAMFCAAAPIHTQTLPILIDGLTADWEPGGLLLTDPDNDGINIELLRMEAANDDHYLFLLLETKQEINLTEGAKLTLYLDTDLNTATGTFINGIGADLEIRLENLEAFYKLTGNQGFMSLHGLRFRHAPNTSSNIFEIAISRDATTPNGQKLFTANGVQLYWKNTDGPLGDAMPNSGEVFTYLFDPSLAPPTEPIAVGKSAPHALRLLTWNTLDNGLDDLGRTLFFEKILQALQPDVITFNECWDMTAAQVATFMNAALPLANFQNWQTVKLDPGNVTASRFPISQNWDILSGSRLTASLIDLPTSISDKNLLVVNAHLRCCDNNAERQREADAFVKFIQDAKSPGGAITLPTGTPFVLSGDLNLVGHRQQLTTLLTGQTVNTNIFGPGGPMDWDGTDLETVAGRHMHGRFAYTWEDPTSDFPPAILDYHIIPSSVMEVEKSFILHTASMPGEVLSQLGLSPGDALAASDHLPKVTDFLLPSPASATQETHLFRPSIFPNPAYGQCQVSFDLAAASEVFFFLENGNGATVRQWNGRFGSGHHTFSLQLDGLPAGFYLLKMKKEAGVGVGKLVIERK